MDKLEKKIRRVHKMRKSDNGTCRVIGLDQFDYTDWIHGEYKTAEEAIEIADRLTEEARPSASDHSIATLYYAYDPDGNYIGGGKWKWQKA